MTSCAICKLSPRYEVNPETQAECNVTTLECGHKFHLTCLLNTLATGDRLCPLCRRVYFHSSTQDQWLRDQRRRQWVELLRVCLYAYCFYRLLSSVESAHGDGLSTRRLFAFYEPSAASNNMTLVQHVVGSGPGDAQHGLFSLLWDVASDLILLQLQQAMFKIYMGLVVALRVINFFIPVIT